MITCVMAFTLCWLPFNALLVIGDQYPQIYNYAGIYYVWFACHFLAMSHACYNPLIYMWMNSRFRAGFCYVFGRVLPCCCSGRNTDGDTPLPDFIPHPHHLTSHTQHLLHPGHSPCSVAVNPITRQSTTSRVFNHHINQHYDSKDSRGKMMSASNCEMDSSFASPTIDFNGSIGKNRNKNKGIHKNKCPLSLNNSSRRKGTLKVIVENDNDSSTKRVSVEISDDDDRDESNDNCCNDENSPMIIYPAKDQVSDTEDLIISNNNTSSPPVILSLSSPESDKDHDIKKEDTMNENNSNICTKKASSSRLEEQGSLVDRKTYENDNNHEGH